MAFQVLVTEIANEDLAELVGFIANDNPQAAQRFGTALVEKLKLLGDHPKLGRLVPERNDPRTHLINSGGSRCVCIGRPGAAQRGSIAAGLGDRGATKPDGQSGTARKGCSPLPRRRRYSSVEDPQGIFSRARAEALAPGRNGKIPATRPTPIYEMGSNLREIIHHPYRIVYRVREEDQTVEVLRFWHGARGEMEMGE